MVNKLNKLKDTNETYTVHVPFRRSVVSRVDRLAVADRRTRVATIQLLVEQALDAKERETV